MYPHFENNSPYRYNSPIRPLITNSSIVSPKPYIRYFNDFPLSDIFLFHKITIKNDEFSSLLLKEEEKLYSVNKYPNDIFLTGFCFWFDKNFKLNGNSKESMVMYINKIRKDQIALDFANNMAFRGCKLNFDERFLRSIGNFWDFNLKTPDSQFHPAFYDSINQSNSSYMTTLYSTYMRICCFYVMRRIKDCYLLKDRSVIQDCEKNFDNYVKYLEDFNNKSFFSEDYRWLLNLLCEAGGLIVKLTTINKDERIFLKETFPTNVDNDFELYKTILKLKFIIIWDKGNSAVYRGYRKPVEKKKFCQECKASFETKVKSSLKNVCLDCFKSLYCCRNKEKLENGDFFESLCKHKYCKDCLIFLYNSNQNRSNINCSVGECKKQISFAQIEDFFKRKKTTDKNGADIGEFKCPNCQRNAIISNNPQNNYVFHCKTCNKCSCMQHKVLIERCDCYCPKCRNKYSVTFQQVGETAHIELLECLECRSLVCKTCKENLKNYEDYCNCKCHLCFELRLNGGVQENTYGRCKGCLNLCNLCLLTKNKGQIKYCKKCKMTACRVCINEIAANEKYQYFSKTDYCIFCENKK